MEMVLYPKKNLNEECYDLIQFDWLNDWLVEFEEFFYKTYGVGLAAPQVGKEFRIFIMDKYKDGNKRICINPEILEYYGEKELGTEGCLSIPNITSSVERYTKIKVGYDTVDWDYVEEELEGLDAVIFQHELDHLNGILFIDRLTSVRRRLISDKLKRLRKKGK